MKLLAVFCIVLVSVSGQVPDNVPAGGDMGMPDRGGWGEPAWGNDMGGAWGGGDGWGNAGWGMGSIGMGMPMGMGMGMGMPMGGWGSPLFGGYGTGFSSWMNPLAMNPMAMNPGMGALAWSAFSK